LVGLRSSLVTRNMPDLPADLNREFLNETKVALQLILNRKYNNNTKAKIAKVNKILSAFKNGSISKELNCRENWWAAKLVLFELEVNGKKEA